MRVIGTPAIVVVDAAAIAGRARSAVRQSRATAAEYRLARCLVPSSLDPIRAFPPLRRETGQRPWSRRGPEPGPVKQATFHARPVALSLVGSRLPRRGRAADERALLCP